ncbi:MAG: hypothetical protein H6717_10140 [Polyangiaceae bacterium]|nr:hypothetical protein [Polyangiaceae bacterium]
MRRLLLALWLSSCAVSPPPPEVRAAPASPMAAQTPAPNFTDDSPGPPDDPLWQRAGRADAIDLAALAEREGATGLEAQLGRGGSAGRTALLALPFAPDAELAAGRLCRLASEVDSPSRPLVLLALHGVLSRPPPGERLDAAGLRRCQELLRDLAARPALPPSDRDHVAAARALLEQQLQ